MREIPLTQGKVALVDDEDYEWLSQWKWCALNRGDGCYYAVRGTYDRTTRASRQIRMHRQIMGMEGSRPDVDHKDTNGLNNQRSNLREASRSDNIGNARLRRDNVSGLKGVTWMPTKQKWRARIGPVQGQRRFLGYFPTAEEAARAYDAAALELFGDFARPNFPLPILDKRAS